MRISARSASSGLASDTARAPDVVGGQPERVEFGGADERKGQHLGQPGRGQVARRSAVPGVARRSSPVPGGAWGSTDGIES